MATKAHDEHMSTYTYIHIYTYTFPRKCAWRNFFLFLIFLRSENLSGVKDFLFFYYAKRTFLEMVNINKHRNTINKKNRYTEPKHNLYLFINV